MREVGAACILYQFVSGQPWHWNTIIHVQMLTPFTSSDSTPHTSSTWVVVRTDQLLCTNRPETDIRPRLVQMLFRIINVKELRTKIRNYNTQNHLLNKKNNNCSSTNIYTSHPNGTCYLYLLPTN